MSPGPRLAALIGSTASGKSELGLRLARETGAAILSCDSLLVYKGLDIGTAKPNEEERREIPHYGIDLVELDQPFTAADFARYARPILDEAVAKEKPLLIVGGTGFYLKALLYGVWDAPPTQPELRARLEREAAALPEDQRAKVLHDRLAALDPEYAAKVQVNDTYRVIRALEIIETTGQPVSSRLKNQPLQNPLPYALPILGVRRTPIELERRIKARTDAMFAGGLVAETRALLERFEGKPPRPFFCVGYREVLDHLGGRITAAEARELIHISTRQLAKKQQTFFKGQFPTPIEWYDLPSKEEELVKRLRESLHG